MVRIGMKETDTMTKIKHIEKLDRVLEERTTSRLLDTQYQKAWASADTQMRKAQAILSEFGDADGNIEDPAVYQQYRSHMDAVEKRHGVGEGRQEDVQGAPTVRTMSS